MGSDQTTAEGRRECPLSSREIAFESHRNRLYPIAWFCGSDAREQLRIGIVALSIRSDAHLHCEETCLSEWEAIERQQSRRPSSVSELEVVGGARESAIDRLGMRPARRR